jgi:dTDP-4-amino-4,6-dideoxy-D-galactose acyltransferase
MHIEKLEWDSAFFKFNVGKVIVDNNELHLSTDIDQFKLLYFFVEPDNLLANAKLKEEGALLVDEKITYIKKISSVISIIPNIYSYLLGLHNRKEIIKIGLQSGRYSRFYLDPNFEKGKFEELYTIWLNNSMDLRIAQKVYLSISNNDINGIITIGEKNGRADIGILAVDEAQRGKKIGQQLVSAAEHFAFENNYENLQVVTQMANKAACKFYERCGFYVDSVVNIYHLWKL